MKPMLKVCGLMREEDVTLCVRKGVDICGFVTEYPVPVPWNLDREQAKLLLPKVTGETKSCIVTGGSREKIRDLALYLHPDFVQLHGGESIETTKALVGDLALAGIRVIKTVPAVAEARIREFGTRDPAECARLLDEAGVYGALVDARGPENAARMELKADPDLFVRVQEAAWCMTILGGGVRSDNCAALIANLHPAMLDVMTGVETSPGHKSEAMLDALLQAIQNAAKNN